MKRLILLATWLSLLAAADGRYQVERERMVRDQVEARGISRPDLLQAIRSIPRHLFVTELLREQAYQDRALPIGYGQTISQPYIVALMTESLEPSKHQKVLEIGTGSGYQAAVLAALAGRVFTIEIVPELAESATALLKSLGMRNVTVRCGDGYQGWIEQAPFDRIILTAAPPEIPQALLGQLRPGGKLVCTLCTRITIKQAALYETETKASPLVQSLVVVHKLPDGLCFGLGWSSIRRLASANLSIAS